MKLHVPNLSACLIIIISIFLSGPLYAQSISPYLFGQNHWMADGDEGRVGYLHDLWPRVAESGVKTVRIGGNGYERNFPSRTELNAMIDSIKGIGAEPILQVPRFFTELQAKELVEYYTADTPRKVTLWSIGNEPMLHDENTVEEVHAFILRLAPAMREIAPDIKIFVFDEAWLRMPAHADLIGGRLDITGLKANGRWLIDGVNFHSYPNGDKEFGRDDVIFSGPQKLLGEINVLQELLKAANEKHQRSGEDALLWGLTEFNVSYRNPDREISGFGNPSFLGGQFMAEVFGMGMEYGAYMLNPWCINETDRVATDFGYLGLPSEFYPRSTYYHMQMMTEHMKGEFLRSENNQDYIKTIATADKKTIAVLVMNQHQTQSFDFMLGFRGVIPASESALGIGVDAELDKDFSADIAANTTKLFVFNKKGRLQKTLTYSLKHNLTNQPPVTQEN